MSMTLRTRGLIGVALFALGAPVAAQNVDARAFVTPGTTIAVGSAFARARRGVEGPMLVRSRAFARRLAHGVCGAAFVLFGASTASALPWATARNTSFSLW